MIHAVWLPLLLPFLAGPAGRLLSTSLPPRRAVGLLALTAVGLAGASTCALALLVVPGATHVRDIAALGHLLTPVSAGSPEVTAAVTLVAVALLTRSVALLVRVAHRRRLPQLESPDL
ncbi:M56 family metallopeptidase, partial [Streptomyces sp. NPDC002690]